MSSTRRAASRALAGLLLLPALSPAAAQEAPARVEAVRFEPDGLLSPGDARGLLAFRVGGTADAAAVERTRANLLATGRFERVEPRRDASAGGEVVTFVLSPRRFVRRVDVRGARQVNGRTLRSRIDVQAWHAFSEESVAALPEQVAGIYESGGFPPPRVTAESSPPDGKGGSVVLLRVDETKLPRLASFEKDLGGLPWYTSLATRANLFALKLGAKVGGVNRKKLEAAARKEERRLRGLGWKGATVRIAPEPSAADDGSESVVVSVELGARETLKGKGIDRPVMKEVTGSWKRRNVPLTEGVVNRLARAADEGMRERGYPDVKVTPSARAEEGRRVVVLTAEHGARAWVETVRFEGNASLTAERLLEEALVHPPKLLRLVRSRPGPQLLEEGRAAIAELYVRSGFPEARVAVGTEGEGPAKGVVFTIQEGPRRRISSLSFPGAVAIAPPKLRKVSGLAEGGPYWVEGAEQAAEKVRVEYGRLGYAEAAVTPSWGAPDETGGVPLELRVTEGLAHVVGGSIVRGNFKTGAKRILALGTQEPGKPADAVALAEHQARLARLGLFDTVSVRPEKAPGDAGAEQAVVVAVTERPTGYFEWGLDVNTDRGVEVAVTLGERNLLGKAVNGSVSTLLGTRRQNLTFELGQPVLLGLRLYNGFQGSYTNDETYDGFVLRTVSASAGLSWEFDEKRRASLTYKLERQEPVDVQPDVDEELEPEVVRIGSLTPAVTLDGRDDMFVPTTGTYFLGRVKVSRQAFGGQVDYERWELDVRGYRPVLRGAVLAAAVRVGYSHTAEGQQLPVGERFFVGGATTHRGFRQNELGPLGDDGSPLGGTTYALGNVEVRFPLLGIFEAGAFLDVGNAYEGRIDLGGLRWGVGGGLRMKTPVGPLRFDAGLKLGKREGESAYALHLALGHAF